MSRNGKYLTNPQEEAFLCALHSRYPKNQYIILKQVTLPMTEENKRIRNRTADALVLGLWASRDLRMDGFEMKASANDWKFELSNPRKAEDVAQYCDTWSVLSMPGVVEASEVPVRWGWYELENRSIVEKKKPEKLSPIEPTRGIMTAITTAIIEQTAFTMNEKKLSEEYSKGVIQGRAIATAVFKEAIDHTNEKHRINDERYNELLSAFSELGFEIRQNLYRNDIKRIHAIRKLASLIPQGHTLDETKVGRIISIFRLIDSNKIFSMERDLISLRSSSQRIFREIDSVLQEVGLAKSIDIYDEQIDFKARAALIDNLKVHQEKPPETIKGL